MKIALYIGDHSGDSLLVRLGWILTRAAQKGAYKQVTHCEAIHAEHADGTVTIASSSLRDGGVRTKRCTLTPGHWIIVDVPLWDVGQSIEWFSLHDGEAYDWRGAVATVLPGHGRKNEWFCNEAVGASVGLQQPDIFGPAQFAAIAFTLSGRTGT